MNDLNRQYLKGSTTVHLVTSHAVPFIAPAALCGIRPRSWRSGEWLGTGTQDEYDRAAQLRECKRCEAIRKQRETRWDVV